MDVFANSSVLVDLDRRVAASRVLAWCGTLTLAGVIRFYVPIDWVAPAWAGFVVVLAAIAWETDDRVFLDQAIFLSFVTLFRAVTHNFYERSYFLAPLLYSRAATVGVTVALLFLTLGFAFRLRRSSSAVPGGGHIRRALVLLECHPEQVLFFCALILLTALIALEFDGGYITIAWGIEGVGIFLFALWMGERSYRVSGLGLLLLCVGKIGLVDFWRLESMRDKAITFLSLGGALLLVSFMYTRKRELIRRFLGGA